MAPPRLPRSPVQRQAVARGVTPLDGGGRSALVAAEPRQPPPASKAPISVAVEAAAWASDGGVIVTDVSDPYEVLIGGSTIDLIVNLTAAVTGDTDIDALVNGVAVGTVTVASTTTHGDATFAEATVPGDIITLETTAAGTGPSRAIAQVKIT